MVSFLVRSTFLIGGILLLPVIIGDYWAFQLGLFYLYAIAALGVGICWGQAGFISIGHAAFVGLSAYLAGFALIYFINTWLWTILLLLIVLFTGLLTYLIGQVVFRGRTESGPYFALITLAFSLLAYQTAMSWYSVTGGFNGLKGIPGLPGVDGFKGAYYLSAAALVVNIGLGSWLINAPIGVLWRGLAQNERRIAFFGFDPVKLKALAFGVSGLLAGIAGVLYAPQQSIVSPELCGFLLSTDLVVWAAVGGRSSLLGPVMGAVFMGTLA